ncbi:MAG: DNA phosphorothioation-dependent restriction protein DptG [Colwellia sp.]|jgi:dnd system-associated protein 1
MTILKKELEVATNNSLNSYFPVRTSNSSDAYDWSYATAIVIRNLYQRSVSSKILKALKKTNEDVNFSNSLALLSKKTEMEFSSVLDEEDLWPIIEDMYLKEDVFKKLAPESALFGILPYSSGNSKNRLADLFLSIMSGFYLKREVSGSTDAALKRLDRNFLEEKVVDCLRSEEILDLFDDKRLSKGINEKPYLPYLTSKFKQDLELLGQYPAYLIENLTPLLKLYGFLYASQLALNINGWRSEPKSRPVFFIMENETASRERRDLISNGYQNLAKSFKYIFPFLSVSESLQEIDKSENQHRLPLWDLASKLQEEDASALKKYTKEFYESRNLKSNIDYALNSDDKGVKECLETLLKIALDQFNKGETRAAAQGKFVKAIELELCSEFFRSRGQLGKILVINQDYLSLLTNVCIGKNEKLRFHELLKEFEERGVYFDKQSQQALIIFYERVGNVERMSDSGDAVYVRKTV